MDEAVVWQGADDGSCIQSIMVKRRKWTVLLGMCYAIHTDDSDPGFLIE